MLVGKPLKESREAGKVRV